jgi:hypothetical protein
MSRAEREENTTACLVNMIMIGGLLALTAAAL